MNSMLIMSDKFNFNNVVSQKYYKFYMKNQRSAGYNGLHSDNTSTKVLTNYLSFNICKNRKIVMQ